MMTNKEKNFISAVIYVHNQAAGIGQFLETISGCLERLFEKYELICVDDASADGSAEIVKQYAESHPEVTLTLVHMSFFQGMELSMNAGVDLAIGDFVYEFDSPCLAFPAELVSLVYFQSLRGYDIVAAAPRRQAHRAASAFYFIFNRAARCQYMLRSETFRILSRRAINRVHSMSVMIPYRKAVYANCGLKIDTLWYAGEGSKGHKMRETRRKQGETAVDAMILYTDLACRCSMLLSFLMMAATALIGCYAVFIYCSGKPVEGWTTTILFLAIAFFALFTLLTIVIKYLSLILKINFNRQKYIVEGIEKI